MLIHSVYFWLKDDLTDEQKEDYLTKLKALGDIPSVKQFFVGTPSSTDRPVIDRTYSYALLVTFDDMAGHDEYQAHPIHDTFRLDCAKYWEKVVIYDAED